MSTLHVTDIASKIDTDTTQRWDLTVSNGRIVEAVASRVDGEWVLTLREVEDDLSITESFVCCVPVVQAAMRLTNNWLRQFTA